VGEELKIPVYLYEKAAKINSRSNLSIIRAGEYEGFFEKIKQPEWNQIRAAVFNEKFGARQSLGFAIFSCLQCELEHEIGASCDLGCV